jgi:monoamine oxidase
MRYDAIIIGGGLSGLYAANMLAVAQQKILLLEAKDRLGGRVQTRHLTADHYADLGGQWVGPGQTHILALLQQYQIPTYPTYCQGKKIIDLEGKVKTYTGLIPKMDWLSLLNLEWAIRKLDAKARQVPLKQPFAAKNAETLSQQSLGEYLHKLAWTASARKVLFAGLETVFACDLNQLSLLHALFYIHSGMGLQKLLSIVEGAQETRIEGGMQKVVDKMAAPILPAIRMESPVLRLEQQNEEVVVTTPVAVYRARRAIVAIPPPLYAQIAWAPALPLSTMQWAKAMYMGTVAKYIALYPTAFWREKGFSGEAVADEISPFQAVFDSSPADAAYGALLGFAIAERAEQLAGIGEAAATALMLQTFTRYFGPEAANPIHTLAHSWKGEPWILGCYAGMLPPGKLFAAPPNFAPFGLVHWAGTETASTWNGYMEGAIRAGERAANEVLIQFTP